MKFDNCDGFCKKVRLLAALKKVLHAEYDAKKMLAEMLDTFGKHGMRVELKDQNPEYIESAINDSQEKYKEYPNPITVYRGFRLTSLDMLKKNSLGLFWTTEKDIAGCKTTATGNEYIVHAKIKKENINWEETIMRDIANWDEYEIIPNKSSNIEVINIFLNGKPLNINFSGKA